MSSYHTLETSRRQGKPVYLYRFLAGTVPYTYTDADKPFEYLSETYVPLPLKNSATGQSQEVNAQRITISGARDWLIPMQYVAFVPSVPMFLTIFRFHRDNPADVFIFWQGFVRDAKWRGGEAAVECDPILVFLDRLGLRRTYQALCNNILYDGFCPVPMSAFRVDGILLNAPTGFTLDAAEWAAKPDNWFQTGFIERSLPTGVKDLRFITGNTGTSITLLSPFPPDLQGGETLSAYAGCDRLFSTCAGKFGAYTDTGGAHDGWPNVPKKNPFNVGIDNV